jgi:hypothetical protein
MLTFNALRIDIDGMAPVREDRSHFLEFVSIPGDEYCARTAD